MAIHKKNEFSQEEQDLASFAHAIAHPARISILKILASRGECICGEIVEGLPLAQSTVSRHLRELKDAGLINGVIDGPRSCYCINQKAFEQFSQELGGLFKLVHEIKDGDCC